MSDPVIKGAKRTSSRPAPHGASPKSSAKSRKLTAKSAQPKPKRAAAEKAPVRKATPTKTTSKAKTSRAPAKQAKPAKPSKASQKAVGKARPAAPSKKAAPGKSRAAAKPQPKKVATKGAPTKTAPGAKPPARHAPPQPKPKQPSRDEAAALKAFERAHREFTRGHFAEARNLFRALIEQHAGVSEVTARARTYLAIAEARTRSEAALPRDPDTLYDRGVIELNRGDFVAAQEMFERALKRDPDAPDTHYALAATRARLGSVELALQSLERAVELRPALRVRAQTDADFGPLRSEPEFERIIFPSSHS